MSYYFQMKRRKQMAQVNLEIVSGNRSYVGKPAARSRPFGAAMCKGWGKQVGDAPAGAQSYWQGRFAACAPVDFSFGMVARETVWALPHPPTRERRPLTPQGTLSLDPFWAAQLGRITQTGFLTCFFLLLTLLMGHPDDTHYRREQHARDRPDNPRPIPCHRDKAPRQIRRRHQAPVNRHNR